MMNLLNSAALHTFLLTVVYTLFGLIVFALAFWIIVRVTPFSIRKEIEDDQNTSLAILIGAVILGLAIIIASVIHG
jgi:putative membrane protein